MGGEEYSGKGVDIWAMGITLYCFVYGKPPFLTSNILELHEMIINDPVPFPEEQKVDPDVKDLLTNILEKDPKKRYTMDEIRKHKWVTKNGTAELMSKEENCQIVEVDEQEVKNAVRTIPSLATVVSCLYLHLVCAPMPHNKMVNSTPYNYRFLSSRCFTEPLSRIEATIEKAFERI